MKCVSTVMVALCLLLSACAGMRDVVARDAAAGNVPALEPTAPDASAAPDADSRVDQVMVRAPSLEGNRLGNPTEQPALVFVPPFIQKGERFPVLYVFHGFGDSPTAFRGIGTKLLFEMDRGALPRFIIVAVNGANKDRGGTFWVNSPLTGNWEDFAVKDMVAFVDSAYPTIADASGRGLLGFSMGGFAVLNLGLAHADTFGSVFSVSPGAFDANGLRDAMPTWDMGFRISYSRAFSPGEGLNAPIPAMTDAADDLALQEQWKGGFGRFEARIARYLAGKARLQGIRIEWGSRDSYPWIPRGSAFVAGLMAEAGIPVGTKVWVRGHDFDYDIVRNQALPFFLELWAPK